MVYFATFVSVAFHGRNDDEGLLFGFCVWGEPVPDDTNGCHHDPHNSHVYAFIIDGLLTALVVYWYHCSCGKDRLLFVTIGGIILTHGILHLILYQMVNCFIDDDDMPPILYEYGYILFAVFTFFLTLIILSIGFVSEGKGWGPVILASLGMTAWVVIMAKDSGSEWFLPCLFAVSHPLSSVTGLFSKSQKFSSNMGWAFLVATLAGFLELTSCDSFYREIGGHIWYDVALHAAVLVTLPPLSG